MAGVSLSKLPHTAVVNRNPDHLPSLVILSGAKDLTQTAFVTLGKRGGVHSAGEVPHFVRDDPRSMRDGALFTGGL